MLSNPAGVVIKPPYAQAVTPVIVNIGGKSQNMSAFVTAAGEWKLNVTNPMLPSGNQPLQATVGSMQTPGGIFIAVQ